VLQVNVRQALRPDVTELIRKRGEEDKKDDEGRTARRTPGRGFVGLKRFICWIGISIGKWLLAR
jgi:hypothetical protein